MLEFFKILKTDVSKSMARTVSLPIVEALISRLWPRQACMLALTGWTEPQKANIRFNLLAYWLPWVSYMNPQTSDKAQIDWYMKAWRNWRKCYHCFLSQSRPISQNQPLHFLLIFQVFSTLWWNEACNCISNLLLSKLCILISAAWKSS